MKRIAAVVAALGLVVTACGGGDDDSGTNADAPTEADAAADDAPADEPADEAPADDEEPAADTDDAPADEPSDDNDADVDDGEGQDDDGNDNNVVDAGPIRSIDDVPEACRDQMAEFLRGVEPIVSSIDWETATFADFETIAEDFEAKSDQFEQASTVAGCDDLDFVDDNEFDLMIDFARGEAPGTVGFLEFISSIDSAAGDLEGDGGGGESGFADCDEAVAFVQGLIDDYDSFAEVPASELLRFSSLATIFMTCSQDQLDFFDSPEVNDFLSGS